MRIDECPHLHNEFTGCPGKMDPVVKAEWVTALRSGEYSQTHGVLRNDSGYCCIGVLCDKHNPDGWSDEESTTVNGELAYRFDDTYTSTITSFLFSELTGLRSGYALALSLLMAANDGDAEENCPGHSFTEIADWIEENL